MCLWNIFIGDRYISDFADLAAKCLFPPIFGRFLGFPLNVVGYWRDPKRYMVGWKHAIAYRSSRSVKNCDSGAWRRKQKQEKRKEMKRCDKSHMYPDHQPCATSTKDDMWSGVPDAHGREEFYRKNAKLGQTESLPTFRILGSPLYLEKGWS